MYRYLQLFILFFVFGFMLSGSFIAWAGDDNAQVTLVSTGGEDSEAESKQFSDFSGFYKLGAGDRMLITVYGEPDLSGEFGVDGKGFVSFPLIGNVQVMGLSVQEVEDLIKKKLEDGYIRKGVKVQVLSWAPLLFN